MGVRDRDGMRGNLVRKGRKERKGKRLIFFAPFASFADQTPFLSSVGSRYYREAIPMPSMATPASQRNSSSLAA